jgi:RNA polymerase sigma-70 factor (ECF subfamily)
MIRQSSTYALRIDESDGEPRYFVSFKDGQAIMREVEVNREIYLALNDCRKHEKRQRSFYERHTEYSELTDETLNDRARYTPKTVEDTITEMERSEVLQKAIAELPEIQRRRFVLYCDEGMTYAAIGRLEGCSATSVKSSVDRAKAKIIKKLEVYT